MTHCSWFEDFTVFIFLLFPSMFLLKSCPLLTKAARFALLLKVVCVKCWPSQLPEITMSLVSLVKAKD